MQPSSKYSVSILGLILALIISCEPDKPKLPDNLLNGRTTAIFNPDKSYGTVTDIDGNVYKTIQIGNQTWMAENLRVTHYRNGDEIPNIKDTAEWAIQTQGAYCNLKNTEDLDTIATYGRLYNWYVTQDSRNIAPVGWRVANYADWGALIDYLGGGTIASKHLKEAGHLHWEISNIADNSSGFTALPGSSRYYKYYPIAFDAYAVFWTSSLYSEVSAPFFYLFSDDANVYTGFNYKVNGYSIRCIKE